MPGALSLSKGGIGWDRSRFLLGILLALPTVLVLPWAPELGLALAVGVLPAAAVPIAPRRRGRVVNLVVASVTGVSLVTGSLLGSNAIAAVPGLFVLGLAAAVAGSRGAAGRLGLQIAYPLAGIGLSFSFPASAVFAGLMILSGAYAWAVSLLWPDRTAPPVEAAPPPSERAALGYGIRLGLAGATAAAVGFLFELDHKGWVCAATLMVMRPATDALIARGVGRALSVLIGALLGALFMLGQPSSLVAAGALALALAVMAATQASRWYVTPAFTSFVVLVLLLWHNPDDAQWRFFQRTFETVLGVVIALLFGVVLPLISGRRAD